MAFWHRSHWFFHGERPSHRVRSLRAATSRAFFYGDKKIFSRSGFILRRTTSSTQRFAEASPLAGHSAENLEQVELALLGKAEAPPSLAFALSCLDLGPMENPRPVRSNALLRWTNFSSAQADLRRLISAGYTHCKLKLLDANFLETLALIEEFPSLRFRLDGNRELGPDRLFELVKRLGEKNLLRCIDYLEEPFAGVWESPQFAGCPIPLAADESIFNPSFADKLLRTQNSPAVFILKPTVLGSLATVRDLISRLKEKGRRVVITSTIETEVGRRSLLAFLASGNDDICGLSTGFLFEENFLPDQAEWLSVPSAETRELAWLSGLHWQSVTEK